MDKTKPHLLGLFFIGWIGFAPLGNFESLGLMVLIDSPELDSALCAIVGELEEEKLLPPFCV